MPRGKVNEKAKNFKSAIVRLFKELKPFRVMIIVAVVLSTISSLLAIFTPNVLSNLTNKISDGLIINKDNLNTIYTSISNDLSEDKIKDFTSKIIDLKKYSVDGIDSLKNSTYNGVLITKEDKIKFLNFENTKELPDSIASVLISDVVIDDKIIKNTDIAKLSGLIGISDQTEIYKKLDEMPDSIKDAIKPDMDMNGIKKLALFLIIVYLISAIFNYVEFYIVLNHY